MSDIVANAVEPAKLLAISRHDALGLLRERHIPLLRAELEHGIECLLQASVKSQHGFHEVAARLSLGVASSRSP
jgi:hypothetical protein